MRAVKCPGSRGDLMRHTYYTILAYIAVLLFFCPAIPAAAKAPDITAHSAVLMDAGTGRVFFEKRGFSRSEPASLTKIMTAILALEYGHPEEIVTVRKKAARISVGQELGLAEGDRITLENLIKAALIYSANDSTVAIAQHVAGTEERFIDLMNVKALVLGAMNTRFANTNGYHHPNHYTTAHDLALITRYALNDSKFAHVVSTPRDTIYWADGKKQKEVNNTNKLVRDNSYEGICGVKTGSTIRAGNCLIAAARRGDRTLISVVLHSRNRFKDSVKLLDYGFNKIIPVTLCAKSEDFGRIPVTEGVGDSVKIIAGQAVEVYMDEGNRDQVAKKVIVKKPLRAPVSAGQEVGTAIFTLGGSELGRASLVAAHEVKRQGILYRFRKSFEKR